MLSELELCFIGTTDNEVQHFEPYDKKAISLKW